MNGLETVTPLLAAAIAALVAVAEYRRAECARIRERKTKTYADSIRAIADYQELPYRIRRRKDDDSSTRAELASHVSDVQVQIDFYRAWLAMESKAIGDLYRTAASTVRQEAGQQMVGTWKEEPIATAADMSLGIPFDRSKAEAAKDACLSAMNTDLERSTSELPLWIVIGGLVVVLALSLWSVVSS